MKNKNYIVELIKTGNLLDLKLGQNSSEIKSIIEEKAQILPANETLEIWSYGYGLELYIKDETLTMISIKYDSVLEKFKLPVCFSAIKNNAFEGLNSLDDLVDILDKNNIEWEINKNLCDDTSIVISCNNQTDIHYLLNCHCIYSITSRPKDWWIEQNDYWAKKNKRE